MKTFACTLIALALLLSACEKEVAPGLQFLPGGASNCKGMDLKSVGGHSFSEDCLAYRWVDGDTLKLTHINAGFNCCPEGFRVSLEVRGDTLVISERENSSMCDCSCLYDLEYSVSGVGPGDKWCIRLDEQYAGRPGDEPLVFEIDLRESPVGEYCVTRTGYPWKVQ